MTGTPMMNNVGELFSLIHFLRIRPYCEYEKFSLVSLPGPEFLRLWADGMKHFIRPLKSHSATSKEQAMRKLQALLKAVLLRRTKKSTIDGHAILTLPERTTEIQHAVFSEDEQTFYQALETQTQLKFSRYLKQGTVGRNYSNVLVLLLRLRQACCHPHLIKDFGISAGGTGDVSVEDMIALAGSLSIDVVNRIKEAGAIECPICMDLAENATIFTPCGHSTCSECFTRIQEPTHDGEGGEGGNIKCPNCRGKVDTKKVTDYNSFKKVHMEDPSATQDAEDVDPQADIETESESESEDDSDDDSSSLDGFVVDDDVFDSDAEDEEAVENGYRKGTNPFDRATTSKEKKRKRPLKDKAKGKGKGKEPKQPRRTLAQLKAESKKNSAARKKYLRRLERDWETSGKIEKVMELLQATEDRKEGEKTIIFSQFTSLLDLLEIPIYRKDWNYRRYDGSMSAIHRNDAVVDFNKLSNCKIMLVSLKAGNAGLNLTTASQVIILDPFWNPYIEEQAIDRAHRIGQRRPVQVHRILVPSTVEDRIIALQEKKRELIEGALDENASATIGRLGERELAFLFVSFDPILACTNSHADLF
jgi:SNF2 family DNA or RNA helicase